MPKFLVSVVRSVARREVLEVCAESADEARWIALSSCDAWMGAEGAAVTVASADDKEAPAAPALKSAA